MKTKLGFVLVLAAAMGGGCSKTEPAHDQKAGREHAGQHEHKPPHGGTPVELGEEEYHVEFILDPAGGKLQAFVFDGELENFVRISARSLDLKAQVAGQPEHLVLRAVTNAATGETVGDTALFEAQAEWLRSAKKFDAVLEEITVPTKTYTNISFHFPKGNDEGGEKKTREHSSPP
jgi:hypothetical protein